MAAFLKSSKLAIRHNFFIDHYLHQIFTCYKMARWPLIVLQLLVFFETFWEHVKELILISYRFK
jgi:hypothetical protein